MKSLCLLLVGVVVGWAASDVDWSRDAEAKPSNLDDLVLDEPVIGPMVEISNSRQARKVVTPEAPAPIGRFQATAYGWPGNEGCYIVDTATGKTWHVGQSVRPTLVVSQFPEE
ncbi:hypothetical protein [Lacipirellula limnantheis]|uniref:Uncharacterized protein n=1 Tax=Lacipirellula limnantheis TaxID=2528024 RepID=A0A517U0A9_9BACT|nr:hypothetical protein [Lacipirellula limnantheis]QDT74033.1 hypothetical protein I41_32270 [Lacipirellula limnantheis]